MSMDKVEDTKVSYMYSARNPIEIVEDGETKLIYDVKTKDFTITKELKFKILHAIGKAHGELM